MITPVFRTLIVISVFILQAAISRSRSLLGEGSFFHMAGLINVHFLFLDCRVLLDSIAFEGIPVCKSSQEFENM